MEEELSEPHLSGVNYLVRIDSEVMGVTTFNCVFNGVPTGLQWVVLMILIACLVKLNEAVNK